uniref:ANK_REP_REGION domain-containing protein n=1 Tax=Rhabditophanes sp. KR3021 TaxID=114890 RepID=A0AC35UI63_9BILA
MNDLPDMDFDLLVEQYFVSVYDNDVKEVVRILKLDIPVDVPDENNNTALHIASANGFIEMVETLLLWGGSPKKKDSVGMCPLLHACVFGSIPLVELLLRHGADISTISYYGVNVMTISAYYKQLELMKHLQQYDVPLDYLKESGSIVSPLLASCITEDVSIIIFLCLLKDADINMRIGAFDGITALGYCIITNKMQIANLLIELGAEVDLPTLNNKSSRQLAQSFKRKLHSDLVFNELCDDDLNAPNEKPKSLNTTTDLRSLVRDEKVFQINEIFRRKKSFKELPPNQSGLMYSAIVGNISLCDIFLVNGDDINKCENVLNFSIIMIAAACGNDDLVKYLAINGAYLHVTSANDLTLFDIVKLSRGIKRETMELIEKFKNNGYYTCKEEKKETLFHKIGTYFKAPKKKIHINNYPGEIGLKKRIMDNMENTDYFCDTFFEQFDFEKVCLENDQKWFSTDSIRLKDLKFRTLSNQSPSRNSLILPKIPCETFSRIFYRGPDNVAQCATFTQKDINDRLEDLVLYCKQSCKQNSSSNNIKFENKSIRSGLFSQGVGEIDQSEILDILVEAALTKLDSNSQRSHQHSNYTIFQDSYGLSSSMNSLVKYRSNDQLSASTGSTVSYRHGYCPEIDHYDACFEDISYN